MLYSATGNTFFPTFERIFLVSYIQMTKADLMRLLFQAYTSNYFLISLLQYSSAKFHMHDWDWQIIDDIIIN